MTPTRWTWWWYAACACAVMGGLGWASYQAVEFERREAQAQSDARLQEAVRLTLWRMESALAPIIARESSRPYFEYRSFYPADRAYTNMLSDFAPGELLVPSPLLRTPEEPIVLHFEIDNDRGVRSPQVPAENVPLAANTFATGYEIAAAEVKLRELREVLALDGEHADKDVAGGPAYASLALAPQITGGGTTGANTLFVSPTLTASDQPVVPPVPAPIGEPVQQLKQQAENDPQAQVSQNVAEYVQRSRTKDSYNRPTRVEAKAEDAKPSAPPFDALVRAEKQEAGRALGDVDLKRKDPAAPRSGAASSEPDADMSARDELTPGFDEPALKGVTAATPDKLVVQGELVARWVGGAGEAGKLVLVRHVSVGQKQWMQGFWVDWPKLRAKLIEAGGGLIPGATLVPAGDVDLADAASLGRRLAGIPAELVIPTQAPVRMNAWSPLRTTLVMTWVGALGGVIAIGLVLRTSTELAERRGRFVSAVTHELRTPLTTFCLYSQMLSDGIVKDPDAQQSYFNTLRSESQRLARIVESVLDYARLGRRKPGNGKVVMRVGELVDQCVGALAARCEQAGMELVVQRDGDNDQPLTTDPATVERVLFNLVDNACKYAAQSPDKRVHLDVRVSVREVEMYVRDHGPGIERAERGRIFRAFVRGKKQVDGSVSGLGLGLALAKGLAEQLGGDLKLAGADGGAAFSLKLPLGT